jgi:Lipase maturation factor
MADDGDDTHDFRTAWWHRLGRLAHAADRPTPTRELTRFCIVRLLGFVYLAAFVSLFRQLDPLLGARGLLPVAGFLARQHAQLGGAAIWRNPTLFWLGASDGAMHLACAAGIALSAAAMAGVTNAAVQLLLWALYLSFVHVGQIFYGYGWETQLLETGFLAVFLCPLRSIRPLPATSTPGVPVWLMRWLIFRVMLGAALIKLRNDPCWRDLTCLDYHFETQPNPNPVSWWVHHAPPAAHAVGVLFNHFVELVVPWFVFGFRRYRQAAGVLLVLLQVLLIATGNLSFLNWLTIVPALACFDDGALSRFVPGSARTRLLARFGALRPSRAQTWATWGLGIVVAILSVAPIINLASSDQAMNRSFDPLDLVNTYGAFGTIDRERYEVILEGTRDEVPSRDGRWEEYELPCMPGDPRRRPCVITPYHYRLDWQMWFVGNGAARGESIGQEPWLVHLVWQMLLGSPSLERLWARDPFAGSAPKWVRADVWRYAFTSEGGAWWERVRVGVFLPPISLDDEQLRDYVRRFDWPDGPQ